jgi:hypothetical protein
MVRLPDWQDLGVVPRLDARVPISRPDASPIARGAEQLGQGIAKLGQGIGKFAQYQDALARGNLEADVVGLKQQYAQDGDYSTLPERFDADLQKLTKQQAEAIDDASMRQRFLADAAELNAGHRVWADQQAPATFKDAQKASLDQAGQNFIGELASRRTPDGEALGKRQAEFMEQMAAVIEGPELDASDAERQLRTYEFAQALSDEISRDRNEGKNPFDLFRRLPNESDQDWSARASGGRVSVEPPQDLVSRAAAAGLTDAAGAGDSAEDTGVQPLMDGESSQLHLGADTIHAGAADVTIRLFLAVARALGFEKGSPRIFKLIEEFARRIQDPGAGIEVFPSPPRTTAPPARPSSTLAIDPEQKPGLIQRLRDAVSHARDNPKEVARADLGPVENPQELAERTGLSVDLSGYRHTVDSSAIRHALKQHGDPIAEAAGRSR